MVVHFPIAAYLLAAALEIVAEVGRGQPWGHDAFVTAPKDRPLLVAARIDPNAYRIG